MRPPCRAALYNALGRQSVNGSNWSTLLLSIYWTMPWFLRAWIFVSDVTNGASLIRVTGRRANAQPTRTTPNAIDVTLIVITFGRPTIAVSSWSL